jgi:nitrogenase subunit NifH
LLFCIRVTNPKTEKNTKQLSSYEEIAKKIIKNQEVDYVKKLFDEITESLNNQFVQRENSDVLHN